MRHVKDSVATLRRRWAWVSSPKLNRIHVETENKKRTVLRAEQDVINRHGQARELRQAATAKQTPARCSGCGRHILLVVRFLTKGECAVWAEAHGYGGTTAARELPHIEVGLPTQPSYFAFCRAIAEAIEPRSSCLLWIVQHGVWPSSENWHMYYRLRQSYGEQRLLHEAPGHLFLDYESPDLVSFLQIALGCGWDANVFPQLSYGDAGSARVFISHDEYIVLAHRDQAIVEKWRASFESWLKE